ncbi:MAG: DNA polymerase IV [Proteobacteria bacterium]|nr:DNA polymerase IV [Pseudomonadota bacterium]
MYSDITRKIRKIIHLDMDAYYASVEIKDNPDLEGFPVVVGGSPQSRSVVSAANYRAREFGIHSAMPCSMAKRLCPEAVFLPPRFERYQEISNQIHQIFQKYTSIIEPLSLDEAWLDVTDNLIECPSATWIAKLIKQDIKSELGLTSSAGVSYNKFLAKIASDEKKPDGLFVITPENAPVFLENISIKKIPGVGKVTNKKLQLFGIEKGRQLLDKSEVYLVQHFGKLGRYLYQIIRGIDERPVVTHRIRKSVGIETTFASDFLYGEELKHGLNRLLSGLFKRLKKTGKQGKTFNLKIKFEDFQQITRSVTNQTSILDPETITRLAYQKLSEVCRNEYPDKKIRLLGISVSNFQKSSTLQQGNQQLDIFSFLDKMED